MPLFKVKGAYSTDIFTDKATDIIKKHNFKRKPLFLYLSYQAPHAPLEVPDEAFKKIKTTGNTERDVYRAMVYKLDKGVGKVVKALKMSKEWMKIVLVFTTDNGGAVSQGGNNHPLRGTKGTLFEGGTRGVAFVVGGRVARSEVISSELIHITDWYPTHLAAARESKQDMGVDGVDQWEMIKSGGMGLRQDMVYNLKMRPLQGAVRIGNYKLMFAQRFPKDEWFNTDEPFKNKGGGKKEEFEYENIYENTDPQVIFEKRWPELKKHLFNVAPHAPLEVPNEVFKKIKTTGNTARDVYRSMVYKLKEGVGKVVKALKMSKEWKNTLLVFTTDNGGAVGKGGNNHPLRGTKGTLLREEPEVSHL